MVSWAFRVLDPNQQVLRTNKKIHNFKNKYCLDVTTSQAVSVAGASLKKSKLVGFSPPPTVKVPKSGEGAKRNKLELLMKLPKVVVCCFAH